LWGCFVPSFDFLTEPLLWVTALAALVAALVRGFSGFGAGLIFMPIAAACLGPKEAAGILYIVDTILILPFVARAVPRADWHDVLPLGLGAILAVPPGVAVLLYADPIPLRWGLSIAILVSIGALAAGLRYTGPTRVPLSLAVGAVAGFLSGSVQIPGPPVLIYWLGRKVVSRTMRANAIVFFMFTTVISGIGFLYGGIFTTEVMAKSAALFPAYAIGIFAGSLCFGRASDATYRSIAYATILISALISMPVFG
jgi:uncharacterized membrane protein YfcA